MLQYVPCTSALNESNLPYKEIKEQEIWKLVFCANHYLCKVTRSLEEMQ